MKILVINAGSSSLKYQLIDMDTEAVLAKGLCERIGIEGSKLNHTPEGGEKVYCYGLKDHFGILCDGTVVPCCLDRQGELALGNIFDQPITEILDSPRAKAILEGFRCRKAPEELCRKCGYARRF